MDYSSQTQIPATDLFSEVLNHSLDLLIRHNFFVPTCSDKISRQSAILGQELFLIMLKFRDNILTPECLVNHWLPPEDQQGLGLKIIKTESLDCPFDQPNETTEETQTKGDDNESQDDSTAVDVSQDTSDDDLEKEKSGDENASTCVLDEVNEDNEENNTEDNLLETLISDGELNLVYKSNKQISIRRAERIKVVSLARQNPDWNLKMLREKSGCNRLISLAQLADWQRQVKRGGTINERVMAINGWVYSKVVDAVKKNEKVSNSMIIKLALQAKATILPNDSIFSASVYWLKKFKSNYGIVGSPSNLRINGQQFNNKKSRGDETEALDSSDDSCDDSEAPPVKKSKLEENSITEGDVAGKPTGKKKKQTRIIKTNDKRRAIKTWVFDKCMEAKMNNLPISNDELKKWAIQAKKHLQFKNLLFTASPSWIHRFKRQYNIIISQDTVELEK